MKKPLLPNQQNGGEPRETASPKEIDNMVDKNKTEKRKEAAQPPRNISPQGIPKPSKREVKRLMQKFPTPETALLAASWGEDETERWMKSGGDPSEIPEKDKNFVTEMLPKIQQGRNEAVESRRVSQDPDDGTPNRDEADIARQRAREEMLAASISQGGEPRSGARRAARSKLEQMNGGETGERGALPPETSRQAPDRRG